MTGTHLRHQYVPPIRVEEGNQTAHDDHVPVVWSRGKHDRADKLAQDLHGR